MKNTLLFLLTLATNFAFGQITLDHTFNSDNFNDVLVFSNGSQLNYVSAQGPMIYTFNADYTVKNSFTVQIPTGMDTFRIGQYSNFPVSQQIFNTDNLLEFFIWFWDSTGVATKIMIVNETGTIIKDFTTEYSPYSIEVFHNTQTNTNLLKMGQSSVTEQVDIYSLPTSVLGNKEILENNKLTAFPIPTNKILNVVNPQTGDNVIKLFDSTGKLVQSKIFDLYEKQISIDVGNLPNGVYLYKIGSLSNRFIKN